MHVILKPFIKLFLLIFAVFGIAEIAGVDVDELLNDLMKKISGDDSVEDAENASEA